MNYSEVEKMCARGEGESIRLEKLYYRIQIDSKFIFFELGILIFTVCTMRFSNTNIQLFLDFITILLGLFLTIYLFLHRTKLKRQMYNCLKMKNIFPTYNSNSKNFNTISMYPDANFTVKYNCHKMSLTVSIIVDNITIERIFYYNLADFLYDFSL